MPRKARIDAPGALHHIIIRGIERHAIFRNTADREDFLKRLGDILPDTKTHCYAWVLMTNHVHVHYIAVRKLGYKCTDVSKTVSISSVTVSKAVCLGSKLSKIEKFKSKYWVANL